MIVHVDLGIELCPWGVAAVREDLRQSGIDDSEMTDRLAFGLWAGTAVKAMLSRAIYELQETGYDLRKTTILRKVGEPGVVPEGGGPAAAPSDN